MMSEPPKQSSGEEICPMCNRLKSKHLLKKCLLVQENFKNLKKIPQVVQE